MTPKEYLIKKGHSPAAIVCNDWNHLNSEFDLEEMLEDYHKTKLKNNEVLDLVSGCFSFAKHFKQNYEFHQYTTEGKEIYITDTGVVRTEYEVMEHWKTYYR